MNVLEINQLYKTFGKNEVISGLDMVVPEHSIYGFVGQNGAGKTTTMKMVLGLLKPTRGKIAVCGEKVTYGETQTNRHIGYLPDVPEFYGYMKPMEYLKLCGDITGLTNAVIRAKGQELLSFVGLNGINRRIGSFSRGMKQRLGIAQALLSEPRLLICDEPTSALDPIGRREILDILASIKGKTTVVFSTHILSDVERICDNVAVLSKGKLALNGTLSEIKSQHKQHGYIIVFSNDEDAVRFLACPELKRAAVKVTLEDCTLTVFLSDIIMSGQFLIDLLSQNQIIPLRFEIIEATLENLFMEAVQ